MQPYEKDIQACLEVFKQHGTILYPTDTVWGLGCPANDHIAIQKIFELKKRPTNKSFILLMTDVRMLMNYIANPFPDLDSIISAYQEPTTFIYPNGINLPDDVIAENGSIAVRITKDPFCRSLIKRIKTPLVSTSANLSGEPTAQIFKEVNQEIVKGVDYCVTWRQDDETPAQPSSIFLFNAMGELTKIR